MAARGARRALVRANLGVETIEDEYHVLTQCPLYKPLKNKFKFYPNDPFELVGLLSNQNMQATKICRPLPLQNQCIQSLHIQHTCTTLITTKVANFSQTVATAQSSNMKYPPKFYILISDLRLPDFVWPHAAREACGAANFND